jgi:hypothetical protein
VGEQSERGGIDSGRTGDSRPTRSDGEAIAEFIVRVRTSRSFIYWWLLAVVVLELASIFVNHGALRVWSAFIAATAALYLAYKYWSERSDRDENAFDRAMRNPKYRFLGIGLGVLTSLLFIVLIRLGF